MRFNEQKRSTGSISFSTMKAAKPNQNQICACPPHTNLAITKSQRDGRFACLTKRAAAGKTNSGCSQFRASRFAFSDRSLISATRLISPASTNLCMSQREDRTKWATTKDRVTGDSNTKHCHSSCSPSVSPMLLRQKL